MVDGNEVHTSLGIRLICHFQNPDPSSTIRPPLPSPSTQPAPSRGQASSIPAPEPTHDGHAHGVLLDERHRFFDGLDRMHVEPDVVEDGRLVRSGQPSGLNPRVGKAEPVNEFETRC